MMRPMPNERFTAKATDGRGSVLFTGTFASRQEAMSAADRAAPNAWGVMVRGEWTSDGTHWGEGRGRLVAHREPQTLANGVFHRGWIIEF